MFFSKKKEKVSIHGRSGLEYQQGGKKMLFEIEMMAGQPDIVIYLDQQMCWEGEVTPLSETEMTLIKADIEYELSLKSITFEWE